MTAACWYIGTAAFIGGVALTLFFLSLTVGGGGKH